MIRDSECDMKFVKNVVLRQNITACADKDGINGFLFRRNDKEKFAKYDYQKKYI